GYFLNGLIPQEWIKTAFGSGNVFSVPLAAILGIPFYLNTEASMPLVKAFMDSGMSAGAALAFLITGAGTSIGALAGALTIARWRVIAIVVGTLVAGAIVLGTLYDLLVPMIA
ncbi:MAG: permease, partial [Chloroflexi bacterium]|nr:permease [Chloroflexota bacterium]